MTKANYLKAQDVADFIVWFSRYLGTESLEHSYTLPGNKKIAFKGLYDALNKYEWNFLFVNPANKSRISGKNFSQSESALNMLASGIRSALTTSTPSDNDARLWSEAIMSWGGVENGNIKWLRANSTGLAKHIENTKNQLSNDNDDTKTLRSVTRFNAGMTKVYSLLIDSFIIYDSRVAAALAWFIAKWCRDTQRNKIPELLLFPCMRPKESDAAKKRKSRNPSCGQLKFPWVTTPRQHARWNLRAGWILENALTKSSDSDFRNQKNPLRALEAALFMWGYDLSESPIYPDIKLDETEDGNDSEEVSADLKALREKSLFTPECEVTWREAETRGGKKKKFSWSFSCDNNVIIVKRADDKKEFFFVAELFRCIHQIFDEFGYDWFPLANNVEKLADGTERRGLGSIILDGFPGNITHAQTASQLGVILEFVGIFEWNGAKKGIEWRLMVELPDSIEDVRLMLAEL